MPAEPMKLSTLIETRDSLIKLLAANITESERKFLLSIKLGNPNYSLLPFQNLPELPALRWKLINIGKMERKKHSLMVDRLKQTLEL